VTIARGYQAAVVRVTPEIAREWLENHPRNRHEVKALIRKYALTMASGRWELNGETIVFDRKGGLRDGQHRLLACIESDTPFDTFVVYGVEPSTAKTLNTGRARTGADVLSMENIPYFTMVAAIANFLWQKGDGSAITGGRPEHPALVKLVHERPELIDAARATMSFTWRPMRNATFGLLWYLCGTMSKKDRDIFFDQLENGTGLERGDPVLLLRRRLEETYRVRARFDRVVMLALSIKAWNARREKKSMSQLSWKADAEPFPTVK
jgi:hypothetical protein